MVTIERKGSDNLAKSGAITVDQPNLGQAPRAYYTSLTSSASVSRVDPYTALSTPQGVITASRIP